MNTATVDQIWGPDNPLVATWPASTIPTAIAYLFVLICLAKPKIVRLLLGRNSLVVISCLYVVVVVLGNMIFLVTRMTLEDRILGAMGSCGISCLPIQQGWQDMIRRVAWAMFIVPSVMLSPFILYLVGEYVRRYRRARRRLPDLKI